MPATIELAADERVNWVTSSLYISIHFVPLLAFVTGVTWTSAALCVGLYFGRMLCLAGVYHRYFAHRTYKLGRVSQFVLAFAGATCAQKGPLWWAAHHRNHHRYSDTPADIHSPRRGFLWSHVGWILCDKYNPTDFDAIKDFAKYPELRWLNRYWLIPPTALAVATFLVAGWSGLVVGFFLSTVLLWHGTYTVNSLTHLIGRRRFATSDDSRNSWLIALWTCGEGWHNNHHHYQSATRNGFYWWEYDPTYYALRLLSFVGIVHDIRKVPPRVLAEGRGRRTISSTDSPRPLERVTSAS
jgi:stearoyl-CoA desaturase (Delta-9 desaturase)